MSEFKREGRYVILKLKHMSGTEKSCLALLLHDYEEYCVDAVVVEADWPIYEGAWDAVQRLSEGKPQLIDEQQKQIDELNARISAVTLAANNLRNAIDNHYPDTPEFANLYVKAMDVIDSQPTTQSLAEHNARVVETMLNALQDPNYPPMMYDRESMEEYASNLRKQGEE